MLSLAQRTLCGAMAPIVLGACASQDPAPKPFVCNVTAPTECPDPMPRYADVEPIIARRCVTCHSDTSTGPWPLTTYQDVVDWWDVIRGEVLRCSMPPPDSGQSLTSGESQLILEWIRCNSPR
jgi:uncharacterized membrane protein